MNQENIVNKNMAAVIQAGGKGSRLRELTGDKIPKPLLSLNGKPMLQWQVENLKRYGIQNFIFIIGYLGGAIRNYFGDGTDFGVQIAYIEEAKPLGSAGALYYVKELVGTKNFLLIFGDVMFDINVERMLSFHEEKQALATLLVHPNSHPYDSDLVIMNEDCQVSGFDSKNNQRNDWYDNLVNAGIYVLSGKLLDAIKEPQKLDLEKDILMPAAAGGRIYGYRTTEYVKDAGTPERFATVSREQKAGLWLERNLSNPQKCVFLDRDGTINKYRGLISRPEEFELEEDTAEAIKLINASGYLAIVVTNQPVVARGMCSVEDVRRIHRKMTTLLGEQGAYLDDIVFCPHHPDKGYPEENPVYKIPCDCRKPATGMIDAMVRKYNIDVSQSYMIGDSTVDIQTGINAGLTTVLLHTGSGGMDGKYECKTDIEAIHLLDAVKKILELDDERRGICCT